MEIQGNTSRPKKIIIKIFASYADSTKAKKITEDFCDAYSLPFYGPGEDKEIYITDGDDYTHVVIWNTAMPWIPSIPKENVIGFAHEPFQYLKLSWGFIEYAKKYIGAYFIGDVKWEGGVLPLPFQEGNGYLEYNPPSLALSKSFQKNRPMSLVLSHKQFSPGHLYRHELCKAILKTDLPIDIYGRGAHLYTDSRVKGVFELNEPYEEYAFSICIENYQINHYFSEKIVNPILCETTPIYLGCRNIDAYLPNTYVSLSGTLKKDMDLLKDICQFPEKYRKKIDTIERKSIIHQNTNLITFLHKRYY
jgi:hypothetical protein